MAKMKERNGQLKSALGAIAPKARVEEVLNLPEEDTVNKQGYKAYGLPEELRLITMLNTLKIQPQFYRSENDQMRDLRDLIERIGIRDPKFVAQCIVYSRCMGEGMRSINHLAAALVAPFVSGQEWAKRFYGLFDKTNQRGGCIFRVDDMSEIKDAYSALNTGTLSNAMKKGFAKVIESLDTYQMCKYKKTVIDIANLVHPKYSKAVIQTESGESMRTLDALMQGINVSADTWEVAQSEAGQEVAKAVKEGKLTQQEADEVLAEAKADNWEALLAEGKLPIMAALRNVRNIMKNPRKEMITNLCKLITDADKIRKGLILPIHFDLAYEVVMNEFARVDYSPNVQQALLKGYENSIPNLAKALPGKTCIIVDCSGSMHMGVKVNGKSLIGVEWANGTGDPRYHTTCSYKAGLIAATIAKATGADIIRFGSDADWYTYSKHANLFKLAKDISIANKGTTNLACAFGLLVRSRRAYDRIIVISDNEINGQVVSLAYKQYIHDVCSPYIYACDLAGYGTTPLKNENKVNYYFGYGSSLYEDIASKEFNPQMHIDKIRKVII